MYKLSLPSLNLPAEPWQKSLAERQQLLVAGEYKIAYYYEVFNNSSFRYRAYNMAEAINTRPSRCGLSASYFCRADFTVFRWLARTANQLVVCRSGEEEYLLELISLFRDQGKTIIFDTDDLVIDPAYARHVAFALGQDLGSTGTLDYWHAYFSRMRATALRCDAICTTNDYLSRLSASSLGIPGLVIKNSLNRHQLQVSKSLYAEKRSHSFARSSRVTIGYFSGSPSHLRDFDLISDALSMLMTQREDVDLLICGYIELPDKLNSFRDRVRYEPFRDYVSLQNLIASCEFCLAPLEYNTFTNCKSELKYFESAAVGTLCIASPTFAFRTVIDHGLNGWISRSHEWLNVLTVAIEYLDERLPGMAQRACDAALCHFGPEATWHSIVKAYALGSLLQNG